MTYAGGRLERERDDRHLGRERLSFFRLGHRRVSGQPEAVTARGRQAVCW
ncbi:hypothetical protein ABT072_08110 [Streptomyces sp. NPDC002589]